MWAVKLEKNQQEILNIFLLHIAGIRYLRNEPLSWHVKHVNINLVILREWSDTWIARVCDKKGFNLCVIMFMTEHETKAYLVINYIFIDFMMQKIYFSFFTHCYICSQFNFFFFFKCKTNYAVTTKKLEVNLKILLLFH